MSYGTNGRAERAHRLALMFHQTSVSLASVDELGGEERKRQDPNVGTSARKKDKKRAPPVARKDPDRGRASGRAVVSKRERSASSERRVLGDGQTARRKAGRR